jgi:RNA polymerase sigma factor (sigma-70 family)
MREQEWLSERFEMHRGHLRAVAYRMLGSLSEADDAVQESWLRISRSDTSQVENLRAWLTTVVARICLNMLRSRRTRKESSLEDAHVPDPILTREDEHDPEQQALLGDSVGLAMMVVLHTLSPHERVAFVLHDVFGVPFEEVAPIVGKSAAAARQLASRARRRVQRAPVPDTDLKGQRKVVDAFQAAARKGDLEGLLAVLDPDIVLRSDGGKGRPGLTRVIHGAQAVASAAIFYERLVDTTPLLVNGAVGVVAWTKKGEPLAVLSCTIKTGKMVTMEVLADPERLHDLGLTRRSAAGAAPASAGAQAAAADR